MDILTHALSGALLARVTAGSKVQPRALSLRTRIVAGSVAALFPDVDIVLRPYDTLAYLNFHQGYTHSLAMLPLWALILAVLFSLATRRRYGWQSFYGVAALGIATHIGLDAITAYGAMLFAPFSERRHAVPLVFVIDPCLTAIVAATLLATLVFPVRRWIAAAGCAALAGYLIWMGALQQQAAEIGAQYAQRHGLRGSSSTALPQPLSPFNRLIIVKDGDRYHLAHVHLGEDSATRLRWPAFLAEMAQAYQPVASARWHLYHRHGAPDEAALALQAWRHPALAPFREFALYPALDHVAVSGDRLCVWFVDLRFVLPTVAPSFRFGLCRSGVDGDWRLRRLYGEFLID